LKFKYKGISNGFFYSKRWSGEGSKGPFSVDTPQTNPIQKSPYNSHDLVTLNRRNKITAKSAEKMGKSFEQSIMPAALRIPKSLE
jgi:hypothetical protein